MGAQSINETIACALGELTQKINLIWQTGKSGVPTSTDSSVLNRATQDKHLIVLPFIENMSEAYAVADLAVCRAGAMTIAELAVMGLPAIFIPYPHATDDHQTANAMSLVEKGAALLIHDDEMTAQSITDSVFRCLTSEPLLHQMTEAMKTFARPQAADDIAEIALSIAKQS